MSRVCNLALPFPELQAVLLCELEAVPLPEFDAVPFPDLEPLLFLELEAVPFPRFKTRFVPLSLPVFGTWSLSTDVSLFTWTTFKFEKL